MTDINIRFDLSSVKKVGFWNEYPLVSVASGSANDSSLCSHYGVFSRAEQVPTL
jgi:hypothetical protein